MHYGARTFGYMCHSPSPFSLLLQLTPHADNNSPPTVGGGAGIAAAVVPFMASDKVAANLGIAFWNAVAIGVSKEAIPTLAGL